MPSGFERDVLLLVAGIEMDSDLAGLCAGASGNGQRTWGSFHLALAALPDPHWSALTPVRPLRQWRLIEISDEPVLVTARLRIDERVLHYLAGVNYLDPRLQPLLRPVPESTAMADGQQGIAQDIAAVLEQVRKQLQKLVHVIKAWDIKPADAVEREHALLKIEVEDSRRAELLQIVTAAQARIVDSSGTIWILEVTGDTGSVDSAFNLFADYRVLESIRTGKIALERGTSKVMSSRRK